MKLTPLDKNDFEQLFELMQEAFPPEEYRTKKKQYAILDDKNYSVTVFKEDGIIKAFIAVWHLKNFAFAEHFAVNSSLRGMGTGSIFLKDYLDMINSPLVLEVENLEDDISKRRVGFYQRAGFILSDIRYDQPNFQNSKTIIPLRIMYHKNRRKLNLLEIKKEIFEKIYKKPVIQ